MYKNLILLLMLLLCFYCFYEYCRWPFPPTMLNAFYAYNENKMGKELYFVTSADQLLHKSIITKHCFSHYEFYPEPFPNNERDVCFLYIFKLVPSFLADCATTSVAWMTNNACKVSKAVHVIKMRHMGLATFKSSWKVREVLLSSGILHEITHGFSLS